MGEVLAFSGVLISREGPHPAAQTIVARRPPFLLRTFLYALLACVIAVIAWAAMAHVDRIVVAGGRLITTDPTIVVQPFETGVIRSIDVAVGLKVRRGQELMTLDPTLVKTSENELRYRWNALMAEVARLSAELDSSLFAPASTDIARQLQGVLARRRRSEFDAKIAGFGVSIKRLEEKRSAAQVVRQSLQARLDIAT